MSMQEQVILVDADDREIGTLEKLKAHQDGGQLHRAFSIFVFNGNGELLLQQRALGKYHSPGKWSNTCCGCPKPGEATADAAHRRLKEEMGFDCKLEEKFAFTYKADVGNGLTEHEYDHVFFGSYDREPRPSKDEAETYRWLSPSKLEAEIKDKPELFTPWLRISIDKVFERRNKVK